MDGLSLLDLNSVLKNEIIEVVSIVLSRVSAGVEYVFSDMPSFKVVVRSASEVLGDEVYFTACVFSPFLDVGMTFRQFSVDHPVELRNVDSVLVPVLGLPLFRVSTPFLPDLDGSLDDTILNDIGDSLTAGFVPEASTLGNVIFSMFNLLVLWSDFFRVVVRAVALCGDTCRQNSDS